jgi:8-oxo-dGTP diphosphatase
MVQLPDGELAHTIDRLRRQWDPAMAAVVPPHLSVVYPEAADDDALLRQRLDAALAGARAFPLDIHRVASDADGRGGVFLLVHDRTGALRAIKHAVLAPPFAVAGIPLHVTIVHPRTSDRGPEAFAALRHDAPQGSFTVSELLWTETTANSYVVRSRYALGAPRVQQVAAVLRRGERVLLCHRSPLRASFPNVWDLPGGHVEPGERGASALARELQEELAITVDDLPDLPDHVLGDDELGVDLAIWVVDSWHGEPRNAAPAEHDRIERLTRSEWEALELADPRYRSLLATAVGAGR